MKARFDIIEISRSIASSIENATLAEQVGFDWVGFAVPGHADECVARIEAIRSSGFHQFLFSGFVDGRTALIKALGEQLFSRCRD